MSRLYHNRFFAMGTRFHALFPGLEQEHGERAFQMIKKEVDRVETKLSRFIPESDLSKINKLAAKQPVKIDDELFELLNACKYCWELTDGSFDLTLRPLMNYWKENNNMDMDSENENFEKLKNSLGMNHLQLNSDDHTVSFDNDDIEIDLGGFGKGYALEKVDEILVSGSVENAFISFGESSILAIGSHPAGDHWKVGMNDYLNPGNSLYEFKVSGGSVSTSSNFYVDDEGKLHNHKHVIDPNSGKPFEKFTSVSVYAKSPALAEMMSTASLLLPDEKIEQVKSQYDEMEIIKVNYETGQPEITGY